MDFIIQKIKLLLLNILFLEIILENKYLVLWKYI